MMKPLRPSVALIIAGMIWLVPGPASAAVFNASTSRPLVPGDNGFEDTLQEVFDAIVTSDSIDDELDQTAAAIFRPAGSSSFATFVISIAGLADSNKFGIYRFGDPHNRVKIFDGVPADSQETVEVAFQNGDVLLGGHDTKAQTGPDGSFGTAFGFYLEVAQGSYVEVFQRDEIDVKAKSPIKHFCLEVYDIEQIGLRLAENGYEATQKRLGTDQSWQMWTTDPTGVRIEFHQYTDRSSQITHENCILG